MRCFAEDGYQKSSVAQIAEAAGVTTGTLYYYFGSKEGAYAAVTEYAWQRVFERFEAAIDGKDSLQERLASLLHVSRDVTRDAPALLKVVFDAPQEAQRHEELREAVDQYSLHALRFWSGVVNDAFDRGDVAPGYDRDATVHLIMALTSGLARLAASGDRQAHLMAIEATLRWLTSPLVVATPAER